MRARWYRWLLVPTLVITLVVPQAGCISKPSGSEASHSVVPLDVSKLSPDERQVLGRLDALAQPDGPIGPGMGDRLLAASDLQALVHSSVAQDPEWSSEATSALREFDALLASKGATATYAAMRDAYVKVNGVGTASTPQQKHLAGLLQSLFAFTTLFSKKRVLTINPIASATLEGIKVSGDVGTLTYIGDQKGTRIELVVDLVRRPDGKLLIGGVRDVFRFTSFVNAPG